MPSGISGREQAGIGRPLNRGKERAQLRLGAMHQEGAGAAANVQDLAHRVRSAAEQGGIVAREASGYVLPWEEGAARRPLEAVKRAVLSRVGKLVRGGFRGNRPGSASKACPGGVRNRSEGRAN